MKIFLSLLSAILVTSCAQADNTTVQYKIRPGEVRWVEFPLKLDGAKLFCRDQEVKFVKEKGVGRAFIMESYFSDLSPFKCVLKVEDKTMAQMNFTVEDREYLAEVLKVDPKKIKLSPKDEARVLKEQAVLNQIYAASVPLFLFSQPFMQPMSSVVTSVYGTKRVYNKKKKGQHLGIDYRAAIGDKVPAANAGKVVFSGDLFYTGWTVIIDHGVDIFSVYGHLSKTLVDAGQVVKRGDLIGLSGNTGRTSGPHLHWGVKVQGQYIDGIVLIEETKKYFRD